jgi:diazepam-binding inhibitor (GABA receptor modulating acyl-CoA-binding protein)
MSDDFEAAVAAVDTLTKDPGQAVKLQLYALYKQATDGDAHGKRPGMMDFVGRTKYDAWAKLKGTSKDAAKAQYAAKVAQLQAAEA